MANVSRGGESTLDLIEIWLQHHAATYAGGRMLTVLINWKMSADKQLTEFALRWLALPDVLRSIVGCSYLLRNLQFYGFQFNDFRDFMYSTIIGKGSTKERRDI